MPSTSTCLDRRLSLITSYKELKDLLFEFEQNNTQPSLLGSSIFINTWYRCYWQKKWRLQCIAYHCGEELVCLAPFYIQEDSFFPYLKTLHFVGQGEPEYSEAALEYLDVYIKPGCEIEVYPIIIKELNKFNFDQCIVKAVFSDSHIAKILPEIEGNLTQQNCVRYRVDQKHWQPEKLSKNTRSRINRCKNQLAQQNTVIRWLTLEEYKKTWVLLVQYHQNRWEKKGKLGAFISPEFNDFHQSLCEKNSLNVEISAIFIDDKPIAIHYYLVDGDTYHFYQSGWDEANFSKLSPGLFLHYWSIINCPKRYYDFMMGGLNNSYKAKFHADVHPMLTILVIKSPMKLYCNKVISKMTRILFSRIINK